MLWTKTVRMSADEFLKFESELSSAQECEVVRYHVPALFTAVVAAFGLTSLAILSGLGPASSDGGKVENIIITLSSGLTVVWLAKWIQCRAMNKAVAD